MVWHQIDALTGKISNLHPTKMPGSIKQNAEQKIGIVTIICKGSTAPSLDSSAASKRAEALCCYATSFRLSFFVRPSFIIKRNSSHLKPREQVLNHAANISPSRQKD